jgi:hypothetical protein
VVGVVPTALLVTAMLGGFAVALAAVIAMAHVLGGRIEDVRADTIGIREQVVGLREELHSEVAGLRGEMHAEVASLRGELHSDFAVLRGEMMGRFDGLDRRLDGVHEELTTVRADFAAVDARMTTLEQR